MKLRCLVVDDEPLAAELIGAYVGKVPDLHLSGICTNAVDAFGWLQGEPVDLLFLDIQMPRLTGIELLKTLTRPPLVIMTTAYREFALEGYELDVVDFLLKPIPFDRFLKAVGKALQRKPADYPTVSDEPRADAPAYLYLRVDKEMVKVPLTDILWVESMKDYVKIRTAEQTFVTYLRISYLEEKLPPAQFLRIHRSFLVAVNRISAFSTSAVRIGATELPIGRNYRNEVLKRLGEPG